MEALFNAFEDAWKFDAHPRIEDFLFELDHKEIFEELLHLDLHYRVQRGELPTSQEYENRFPQFKEIIRDVVQSEEQTEIFKFEPETNDDKQTQKVEQTTRIIPSKRTSIFPKIPGYEITEELGQGGMGVVYKAEQKSLGRMVALKMIRSQVLGEKESAIRFHREAETLAQLQHPNIVQIYEIGEHNGTPYLSLELIEGGNLSRKLEKISYTPRQTAQLMEILARAMHTAHQKGIIHRDLKPGNILLTEDEVPKITDFGLVKRVGGLHKTPELSITHTREIIGTPSYMAPEQAAGVRSAIGPGTDIYALGAILYKMLTNQPPFDEPTIVETLVQVVEKDPIPPRELQPKIPHDLETICLTCLRKDPARRYPSMEALADDLRAFLAGEPIKARPTTTWERLLLWTKRHPRTALLLGFGFIALVGLVIGSWFLNAITVSCVAVLSVLVAAWLHNSRMQKTLRRLEEEHIASERNVERLHLLLETTQLLVGSDQLDEILRILSMTTTRLVNAERATVYLIDKEKGELWSKIVLDEEVGEIRLPLGQGIAGIVASTGETINLDDPYSDSRFNQEVDRRTGFKTRNLLTFAMKGSSGEILGVFQVLNKRGPNFSPEDVELLQSLANSADRAVERAERNKGSQEEA